MTSEISHLETLFKRMREVSLQSLQQLLSELTSQKLVQNFCRDHDSMLQKLFVSENSAPGFLLLGGGKAAASMAEAFLELYGSIEHRGIIIGPDNYSIKSPHITYLRAGHPYPTEEGVLAVEQMITMIKTRAFKEPIVFLLSGGASSLLFSPQAGLKLAHAQEIFRVLLSSGASIHEMNTIRRRISRLGGGGLASLCSPNPLISLILSDVSGDRLEAIGSGPTVADPTTATDALAVLRKYDLPGILSPQMKSIFLTEQADDWQRKSGRVEQRTASVQNFIIGSNAMACRQLQNILEKIGYRVFILDEVTDAPIEELITKHVMAIKRFSHQADKKIAIISGGEGSITVRGAGKGGRNQEFALRFVEPIAGKPITLLSFGTDGIDGPTEAAGAVVDGLTFIRSQKLGCNLSAFIENNDSFHFFEKLNDLIITGPTGTNLSDIRLFLIEKVF